LAVKELKEGLTKKPGTRRENHSNQAMTPKSPTRGTNEDGPRLRTGPFKSPKSLKEAGGGENKKPSRKSGGDLST